MAVDPKAYESSVENAWCPGCGNFGILAALKNALVELERAPHEVLICTGIGQAPKLPHYLNVNTLNGLHGREVATAAAAKLAAADLTVLVHGGDGGIYGEGGNHLLHNIRRNIDMTVCVHDNKVYGLTKGQASPTTPAGAPGPIDPHGVLAQQLNPLALAISQSCSFVAQSMSARRDHLVAMLKAAIRHPGFSLLNVLQPCVSWDKTHTYAYYQKHCYELEPDYDPTDRMAALARVLEESERIPLGVLYQQTRPTFDAQILADRHQPLRDAKLRPEVVCRLLEELK
jgi:2-oxoglutarate ferredoxin oxidoreductase subunit beta